MTKYSYQLFFKLLRILFCIQRVVADWLTLGDLNVRALRRVRVYSHTTQVWRRCGNWGASVGSRLPQTRRSAYSSSAHLGVQSEVAPSLTYATAEPRVEDTVLSRGLSTSLLQYTRTLCKSFFLYLKNYCAANRNKGLLRSQNRDVD